MPIIIKSCNWVYLCPHSFVVSMGLEVMTCRTEISCSTTWAATAALPWDLTFEAKKGVRRSNNWKPREARKVELKSLKSIRKECWRKRQKIFSCNSGSRFFPKKENYLREKDARLKILISFEIVISLLFYPTFHTLNFSFSLSHFFIFPFLLSIPFA